MGRDARRVVAHHLDGAIGGVVDELVLPLQARSWVIPLDGEAVA